MLLLLSLQPSSPSDFQPAVPGALEQILPRFPADFPVPVLIVQHMPVGFTKSLAQRLNSLSLVKAREAEDHDLIRPGVAYIVPAGLHMHITLRTALPVRNQ